MKIKFFYPVWICIPVLLCFSLKAQINVYDTLLKHHLFAHLEAEKKADYKVDKNGVLKRKVSLQDGEVHYHKSHEDSLYAFLKMTFPEKFKALSFYGGENVNWYYGKDSVFGWKKGKSIPAEKLSKVYSSFIEMKIHPKRSENLQKEEEAHFFFYHNYLVDSAKRTIYAFNSLEGNNKGKIVYNESGKIIAETGYYADRKIFYEVKNEILNIYYKNGNRMYCNDGKFIAAFNDKGEEIWRYEIAKRIMHSLDISITGAKIHEYYNGLYALWKQEMEE